MLSQRSAGVVRRPPPRRWPAALCCGLVGLAVCSAPIGGAAEPTAPPTLTLVHLSDLHLSTSDRFPNTPWTHKIAVAGYKLHQPCLARTLPIFAEVVDLVNRRLRPDAVVITGDIANTAADTEALRRGEELIGRLECPVIVVRGDHDPAPGTGDPALQDKLFGAGFGRQAVRGFPILHLQYGAPAEQLEWLRTNLRDAAPPTLGVFCLHRMLDCSALMATLSRHYASTLLAPDREAVLGALAQSPGQWLVLCGHSHTTDRRRLLPNTVQYCTSSLSEYPHELRVVRVRGTKVSSDVLSLRDLRHRDQRAK